MISDDNRYARWFGRVVLIGVAANFCLVLPGLFHPNALLGALGLPLALETPIWPSFACLLLLLLSAFYVPGALDPKRYRAIAYLAVVSRFAGAIFFVLFPTAYPVFGYFDLVFGVPAALLLFLYLRSDGRSPATAGAVTLKSEHVHVAE